MSAMKASIKAYIMQAMANDDGYITCISSTLHHEKTWFESGCVLPLYLPFLRVLLGRMFMQETVAAQMCRTFFCSVAVPPSKYKPRLTEYRLQDIEQMLDRIDQCLIFYSRSPTLPIFHTYSLSPCFLSIGFEN